LISSLQSIQRQIFDAVDVLTKELDIAIFDVRTQQNRLSNALEAMQAVFFENDEEHVRWIEVVKRKRGRDIVRIRISPLDISEHMESLVFDKHQTVIMTSATLAISDKSGNDFTFFNQQVGLNRIPAKRTILKQIPAPFNYYEQAITAVPTDLPFPDSPGFGDLISDFIHQALKISNGSAFILFTSYGLLNKVFNNLHEKLSEEGITPLKQGEMARNSLLNEFRKDKNSVLFATDSFWQGVDVEGEALENVIITKLPFKVPSDPYVEARVEYIERHGGNAFMDYSLPHAILKLKQGFGRLIRKKTDIGSVFILDKRIIEKFYGKFFLKSLPEARIVKGPSDVILQEVKEFFDKARKKKFS
jgi:ATP-dependent DNA helicase DinG